MFKVEVIADSSGKYCGNALTFGTVEEAKAYGRDLASRWILVTHFRVVHVETGEVMFCTEHTEHAPS